VLLAPDPSARLVSVTVSYAAGLADDPNGRRGLAHLVEHVVAERTKHIERTFRPLERAGGWRFNANTQPDATNYFESLPPERLETALWLESDRMGYAAEALTGESFASARELVRSEDRLHTIDGTLTTVATSIDHALYPDWHPYSSVSEGAADLDSIRADDVRAFIETWYSPRNATLAIAGRFDRDRTVALVKHYFESLPSPEVPVRPRLPPWTRRGVELAISAPVPSNQVLLAWRTPAYGEKDDAALDLAAVILAGAGNERFERTLVAQHLATTVLARQRSERDESVFWVIANAAPGAPPGALIDAIQKTIDEVGLDVTAAEVERARHMWRNEALRRLETPWGRGSRLVSLAKAGVEPEPSFDWGFRWYEGIGSPDVAKCVATWLREAHRVAATVFSSRGSPGRGTLVVRQEVTP
jgi:zinc protease